MVWQKAALTNSSSSRESCTADAPLTLSERKLYFLKNSVFSTNSGKNLKNGPAVIVEKSSTKDI
jgi:hypothetical protein